MVFSRMKAIERCAIGLSRHIQQLCWAENHTVSLNNLKVRLQSPVSKSCRSPPGPVPAAAANMMMPPHTIQHAACLPHYPLNTTATPRWRK